MANKEIYTRRQFVSQMLVCLAGKAAGVDKLRSSERLMPGHVLGFYLPFHEVVRDDHMEAFKKRVLEAGANTIVVDIKNESGLINIPFKHPLNKEIPSWAIDFKKTDELLAWAAKNNILIIGRQVVMEDARLVYADPRLAVRDVNEKIWKGGGREWANPFDERVVEYNAAFAETAAAMGFKIIQYDYVRLPADGAIKTIKYSKTNTRENRVAAITAFFAAAKPLVNQRGSLLMADFFGYTAWEDFKDMGIGQSIEAAGPYLDGICPMAYPGLYGSPIGDSICQPDGCMPPTLHNYEIVNLTVAHTLRRLLAVNPDGVVMPWIQAYPDGRFGKRMGLTQFEQQQRGAFDAGATGVMAWLPGLGYHPQFYHAINEEEVGGLPF